jgi:tetratricopeptide (TPR) repeat protein
MRIRLQSRPAKFLVVTVTVVLLAPYCIIAGGRYRAARVAEKDDRASLERAIAMQPNDADYRERLARYLLYVDQDASAALHNYRIASAQNPYSSSDWLGIAQAQLILGNEPASLEATQRAIEADPTTPSVAWEAANLFITNGQIDPALREIRFVLANDSSMLLQGLRLVHRLEPSAPKAVEAGLPPDPKIYLTFITMLSQEGKVNEAKAVWPLLMGLHQQFDPKLTLYFLHELTQSGDAKTALQFWNDLGKRFTEINRLNQPGNLIHNPSFEYDILNGGFDWEFLSSREVDLRTETSDAHDGRRSLLVTFLGERTSDIGMHQYLVLEPNTHYRFRGYMKSALQTANGLQFILVDVANQKRLLETSDSVDDRQWKEFSADFVTAPNTRLCVFLMGRSGGTLVRGNALIDDLHLEKVTE